MEQLFPDEPLTPRFGRTSTLPGGKLRESLAFLDAALHERLRALPWSFAEFPEPVEWRGLGIPFRPSRSVREAALRRGDEIEHAQTVGVLACAGDPAAREELWLAVRAGRYRWICCENEYPELTRGGHVTRMFAEMSRRDQPECSPHGIDGSPSRNMRAWLSHHGGRFVRSFLADGGCGEEGLVPAVE